MNSSKKGPVFEGGTCRCCGIMKKCRLLNVEYEFCGQKEIYFEMFVDCFGLVLSHLEGDEKERLICATCVMRLRDACAFRQQVLQCEEKLLQIQMQVDDDNNKQTKNKIDIKIEIEDTDMDNDNELPDNDQSKADQSDDNAPLPSQVKVGIKKEIDTFGLMPNQRRIGKRNALIETMKAKKDMLLKLNRMRETLHSLEKSKAEKSSLPITPLAKWNAAKTKPFHNIVTLVENSYVCPFFTTFNSFNCVYCKTLFTNPEELREHTQSHDPRIYRKTVSYRKDLQIDIARIDCRLCPESIDNLETFYKHITRVHSKKMYPNIKNEFLKFHLKIDGFSCLECRGSYPNFNLLKKHMAEHFGSCICDICGDYFFDENKLVIHQRIHRDKRHSLFSCEECGKLFKSKHGIEYHVSKAHTLKPTYNCDKCNEVFSSQISRYKHCVEIHGDLTKKFTCEECDKVYDTKKSLNEHNRKSHLKILNHECVICGMKFYLPSRLKDHMMSHTGERNFKCEHCGKTYPRLRTLRTHLLIHDIKQINKKNGTIKEQC